MNKLNILHIQFSTKSAGSCAYRLHRGFLEESNHNSKVLSLIKDDPELDGVEYLPKHARLYARLNCKLESLFNKYDKKTFGMYSNPVRGYQIANHELVQEADVIYVHWVLMGFLSLDALDSLFATGKRVIIFMHDMWYMTGGCHGAINCDNFKRNCEKCPIFPKNEKLVSRQVGSKKLIYQNYDNVHFVSPSHWLKDLGKSSSLLADKDIHFIPNYFKSDIFVAMEKSQAKNELGLPLDKKIICFGGVSIESPYKGWKYLKSAFTFLQEYYSTDEVEILIFGESDGSLMNEELGYKVNFLGYLTEEESISRAYNATDVFVLPSVLDNQPTTVVESLNCGVPVVAFELGGTPDMLVHKVNGYIATPYGSEDFARGIHFCLSNPMDVHVKESHRPHRIMEKHEELLNSI